MVQTMENYKRFKTPTRLSLTDGLAQNKDFQLLILITIVLIFILTTNYMPQ